MPTNPAKQEEKKMLEKFLPKIMAGVQNSEKNTQQMQQDMDLFLGAQESFFEHVQNSEETQEDLLVTIQKNCKAAKKHADRIVDTAKAATAAAWSVLQAALIVGGVPAVLFFLQTRLDQHNSATK